MQDRGRRQPCKTREFVSGVETKNHLKISGIRSVARLNLDRSVLSADRNAMPSTRHCMRSLAHRLTSKTPRRDGRYLHSPCHQERSAVVHASTSSLSRNSGYSRTERQGSLADLRTIARSAAQNAERPCSVGAIPGHMSSAKGIGPSNDELRPELRSKSSSTMAENVPAVESPRSNSSLFITSTVMVRQNAQAE